MQQARRQFKDATPTWIKLCGLRDVEAVRALSELRPHAVGLNFHRPSRRYVAPELARAVQAALPPDVLGVGVFVNASAKEIVEIIADTGLGAVQLHGDEPPELIAELREALPDAPIFRAWRLDRRGLDPLGAFLEKCPESPDAVLVDANVPGAYGGTGRTAPWSQLRDYPADWPPLILAGGLHSGNVAEAIATVRPHGVDTAGGIESVPGVKDPARAAAFVNAARSAPRDSPP